MAGLLPLGCSGTFELSISELRQIWFAQRLKNDLTVLLPSEQSSSMAFFTDGTDPAMKLVSPLVPAGIPANGTFPAAAAYWIAAEMSRLSYELVDENSVVASMPGRYANG